MNKSILLVIVIAAALTVGLYTRPKVVVRNENKQLAQSGGGHLSQTRGQTNANDSLNIVASVGAVDSSQPDRSSLHNEPLSAEVQARATALRKQFAGATSAQQPIIGEKLIALFRQASRYDSAAHYAGLLATRQPTEANLLRAGDQYFEAYTFAVDASKTAALGQQTRSFYERAIAQNPNLLSAKANLAMTYVSTDTPMQGIMLLREVLQQDPTNELALFNMGLLSMRSGQYSRAIDRFRQILVNNPTSRKAQFYLGISLAEAGQQAEAKQVLAQVKSQEKDPQILAAIREYEERLK